MAKYQRVSPKFWQDPKVRRWTDQQKLLAQYLLTCPHRTTEGLFWLPLGYAAQDLGWTIDTVSKVLSSLIDTGFAAYDTDSETVLIVKALKYEAPAGRKQVPGAVNRLVDVPPSPLFSQLRDAAEQYAPDFAVALDEAVAEGRIPDYRYGIDTPSIPGLRLAPSSSNSSSSSKPHAAPSADADDDAALALDVEDTRDEAADQFDRHFWPEYPKRNGKKVGKADALAAWRRLTLDERRRAVRGAKNLARSDQLPKDPVRFLRKSSAGAFPFDDWQTPAANGQAAPSPQGRHTG